MQIRNVSESDLIKALEIVNRIYDNNITFNALESLNYARNRWRVTLRVESSKKAGHRVGFTGRRLISACWHVHGDFFDALLEINPNAVIITQLSRIYKENGKTYGNWTDKNIGSIIQPLYYSEACECHNDESIATEVRKGIGL
jgi:hypothetical protein